MKGLGDCQVCNADRSGGGKKSLISFSSGVRCNSTTRCGTPQLMSRLSLRLLSFRGMHEGSPPSERAIKVRRGIHGLYKDATAGELGFATSEPSVSGRAGSSRAGQARLRRTIHEILRRNRNGGPISGTRRPGAAIAFIHQCWPQGAVHPREK